MATVIPLIAIVGPTASGKSALALDLAERYNGEIICADSRTIYKNLDIGTAKPSQEDQKRVPHWGLDLVEPGEPFSAADFQQYARKKIADIRSRGKVPFLVGGTGLYVDGVILEYEFGPKASEQLRAELESLSLKELHEYCSKHNVLLPDNSDNKRYVIRAIEQKSINGKRREAPDEYTIVVGIATDALQLRQRIYARAEHLFAHGMLEEAMAAGERYGWDSEAMTGNIYKLARRFYTGELTREQVFEANMTADWRLAKRQLTWLKRHDFITWLTVEKAYQYIADLLAPLNKS